MRVLVPLVGRRFLSAAFRVLMLRMLVTVGVDRPIGMPVLVFMRYVLMRMGMAQFAVLVLVGMLLAVEGLRFHSVFIVYRNAIALSTHSEGPGKGRLRMESQVRPSARSFGSRRLRNVLQADVAQLVEQLFRK